MYALGDFIIIAFSDLVIHIMNSDIITNLISCPQVATLILCMFNLLK